MKKILVFGISKDIGGIETFFHNYFQFIDKAKFSFDFVAPQGSIAFQEDYKAYNSKIIPVSFYSKHPIKYIKEVKKIITDGNYDIVYVNMLSAANIIPLKLAYKNKVKKIIAHSHNADIPSNKIRKILNHINRKKISKYANTLIACSKKAGNFLFGNQKFLIINNAIIAKNFEYSKKSHDEIRDKYKISDDEYLVGHIGRFSEQKNQEFIIKIAKELQNKDKVKFILFGEGITKEKFIQEVRNNNLEDMFMIMNNIKDINRYYNIFDVFILPSRFEGLPVVGIEAQFNGLPCFFSNKITKELKFNSNVKFLDIDDAKKWAFEIKKYPKRGSISNELYQNFDIKNKAKDLETIISKDDV